MKKIQIPEVDTSAWVEFDQQFTISKLRKENAELKTENERLIAKNSELEFKSFNLESNSKAEGYREGIKEIVDLIHDILWNAKR